METPGLIADIAPVPPADWEAFAPFTFPHYRRRAPGPAAAGGALALGARAYGRPVGLALAGWTGPAEAELLSVYVQPSWRRQGLGTALLEAIEEAARAAGAGSLSCVYTLPGAGAKTLAGLLRRRGWGEPRPRMYLLASSLERILPAPWLDRYVLPDGFETFPWGGLTAAEARRIREHEGEPGWHGADLSPFSGEPFEPEVSLGLRHRGEVVGWSMILRATPGYLRYGPLFTAAAVQAQGVALPLLGATIRRHAASPLAGTDGSGLFNLACDNLGMIRLMQRRLLPYAHWVRQSWTSAKVLTPDPVSSLP